MAMPRTTPLTEEGRNNSRLVKDIHGMIKTQKMTIDGLAEDLGIGRTTLYRRLSDPGTFTLNEIRILKKVLPGIQVD